MGRPAAAEPEELADLRAEQRPDRGDQFRAAAFGRDPGDRVPGLGVGERDPLEDSVQYRAAAGPATIAGMRTILHADDPSR